MNETKGMREGEGLSRPGAQHDGAGRCVGKAPAALFRLAASELAEYRLAQAQPLV